jgi:hypothetical protein
MPSLYQRRCEVPSRTAGRSQTFKDGCPIINGAASRDSAAAKGASDLMSRKRPETPAVHARRIQLAHSIASPSSPSPGVLRTSRDDRRRCRRRHRTLLPSVKARDDCDQVSSQHWRCASCADSRTLWPDPKLRLPLLEPIPASLLDDGSGIRPTSYPESQPDNARLAAFSRSSEAIFTRPGMYERRVSTAPETAAFAHGRPHYATPIWQPSLEGAFPSAPCLSAREHRVSGHSSSSCGASNEFECYAAGGMGVHSALSSARSGSWFDDGRHPDEHRAEQWRDDIESILAALARLPLARGTGPLWPAAIKDAVDKVPDPNPLRPSAHYCCACFSSARRCV